MMVDFPRLPQGSRPYSAASSGQQPQAASSNNPTATNNPAAAPPAETQSSGFFSGLTSIFKKVASALEAAFDPVDQRVANFQAGNAGQTGAAAATQASGAVDSTPGLPDLKTDYHQLATHVKANQNLGYFEIERGNVNRNLSQFLSQYKQEIDNNPDLRAQLAQSEAGKTLLDALDRISQGQMGTQDVLALQKFIVASNIDIGSDNNPTGIDGLYGPKTHAGLQQAFEALLQDPAGKIATLDAGLERANQGIESLRVAQNGEIDLYDPSRSEALPDSDPVNPTGPPPSATDLGRRIWGSAQQTASQRTNRGLCMQGVRQTLDRIGIHIRDRNGNNLPSAYLAADALATRHQDQFSEVQVSRAQLRSLPPGAIVVWDRNPSAALRNRPENRSNGISHGHIEIIGPNGRAVSDGQQNWGVTMNNNGRYGGFRVFVPNS